METLTSQKINAADPAWHKTRIRILERDNFQCLLCGDDKLKLQIYIKDKNPCLLPLAHPDDAMTTLCSCCDTFVKINSGIQGFRLNLIKARFIRLPKSDMNVRLYRLNETVLFYLFSPEGKIITSYNLSGAVKELCEFLK